MILRFFTVLYVVNIFFFISLCMYSCGTSLEHPSSNSYFIASLFSSAILTIPGSYKVAMYIVKGSIL